MRVLQFKCHLLSDVILNQSAATEGENTTLDFIPGNVFLGIVAAHYVDFGDRAQEVFHSGKVRFGDAHPVCQVAGKADLRTLHVPAALFYPKMKSADEVCYVHYAYKRDKDKENNGKPQQLKQCRNGFYTFKHGSGEKAILQRSFAVKSAYDREKRRSKDEMMYGYESIDAGADFLFSVEVDNDMLADDIKTALIGLRYIGRSRTAQYGTVEIKECSYEETLSCSNAVTVVDDNENEEKAVTVYADGRLIFLDENGEPTFQPTAKDLGIENGEIDWEQSQVRTFQYAPWNGKRMTREQDRCGIEKGSVFVVKVKREQALESQYVGRFRNEGFGKVIYNPDFLETCGGNGIAKYRLNSNPIIEQKKDKNILLTGTPLLDYLQRKEKVSKIDQYIYKKVNEFVANYKHLFYGETFASQWGTVRMIAMQYRTHEAIVYELYRKKEVRTTTKDNKKKEIPMAYLTHGIAESRWKKRGRRDELKKFIDEVCEEGIKKSYGDITAKALINLASEMAKNKF